MVDSAKNTTANICDDDWSFLFPSLITHDSLNNLFWHSACCVVFVCRFCSLLVRSTKSCYKLSSFPLNYHFKTTFIWQDGWKLLLIPSPCNCQADIFLMGLHSTITRTPLLNEKPVTKWRRRALADPILKNWHKLVTKCMCPWVFFPKSAPFANKQGTHPNPPHGCLDSHSWTKF